jgi:glucose 1-dehydrogenase
MKLEEYNIARQQALIAEYSHQPLRGQIALVTGANSGIGEACARHAAAAGATVAINYVVAPDAAEKIASDIRETGGQAAGFQADVSDEGQVIAMYDAIRARWGTLDVLVANAGLQRDAPIENMTVTQWETVINVNLKGQFLCAREAAREFQRRGKREVSRALGKIVHMSSVHQLIPWARHANYAASKGGTLMLMQSLAQELAGRRIRVNAIAPGAIATPINRPAWDTPEAEAKLLDLIPYDRVGVPDDIGRAAVWLSSDASDYIVGATLFIDGGMTTFESFSTGG